MNLADGPSVNQPEYHNSHHLPAHSVKNASDTQIETSQIREVVMIVLQAEIGPYVLG